MTVNDLASPSRCPTGWKPRLGGTPRVTLVLEEAGGSGPGTSAPRREGARASRRRASPLPGRRAGIEASCHPLCLVLHILVQSFIKYLLTHDWGIVTWPPSPRLQRCLGTTGAQALPLHCWSGAGEDWVKSVAIFRHGDGLARDGRRRGLHRPRSFRRTTAKESRSCRNLLNPLLGAS